MEVTWVIKENAMTDSLTTTWSHPNASLPIRWSRIAWFSLVHGLGATAIAYMAAVYFSWATIALAVTLYFLCHISITAGMHRLYAHKAYRATKPLEIFLLIFSIEHYDQIIVLMEGEMLASGTHEELMHASPEYVQIYNSQRSTSTYESR